MMKILLENDPVWGSLTLYTHDGNFIQWQWQSPAILDDDDSGHAVSIRKGWNTARYWKDGEDFVLSTGCSLLGAGDIPKRRETFDFIGPIKHPSEIKMDWLSDGVRP